MSEDFLDLAMALPVTDEERQRLCHIERRHNRLIEITGRDMRLAELFRSAA